MNILKKICYNSNVYPKSKVINDITCDTFWSNILKCANYYKEIIKKNDIITVENTQDEYFLYTLFSLNLLGAIVLPVDNNMPLNLMLETSNKIDARKILKKEDITNIFGIIKDGELKEYSFPSDYDTSLILLSSGSTGNVKYIEVNYKTIENIVKSNKKSFDFSSNSKVLVTGDLSHSYSIMKSMSAIYYCLYLIVFNSKNIVDFVSLICSKLDNLVICTNPTFLHYLITIFNDDIKKHISNIQTIITATSPLSENDAKTVLNLIKNTNIKFFNHYGATELDNLCYMNISKDGYKFNCVGKPMLGTYVEIVDENDNKIISSKEKYGRVRVKSNGYSKYYKNLGDEYFYTGDLGYLENNFLYIVDREKNFFNINGYKISPSQIENIALSYSYVDECICIYDGVLILKVVVKPDFSLDKLKEILYNNLLSYQVPKKIEIVSAIDKNRTGKIDSKINS